MPDDPIRRALLGRWIRQRRMSLGWSLEVASQAAGISKNTWRSAELGQPLQDSRLGLIEQALDWVPGTVLDVLDGKQDEPSVSEPVPNDALPVGSGIDPLDLSVLAPEDREYLRGLYERLRRKE